MKGSLFECKEWYSFVTEKAVHDDELQKCLKDYMQANSKLINRLSELVENDPNVNVEIKRVSEGTVSGGLIKQIQEYHAEHGLELSHEKLSVEANKIGFNVACIA